ncbi:MAG: TIGR01777 family oxidoreductase [Thermoanaerobaculia bacterium]|nr:TIGR01777 family oxidoreductase [Thermoanaerobaculia bacterium]
MRVLISGGSGMIGRRLAERLAARGDAPVVLSRRPARVRGLPRGVAVEEWDAADPGRLAELAGGADALVHLAGEGIASGRWTAERKRRIRESRVRSTEAVAEALRRAGGRPPVLLQGSAVGYYGPKDDEVVTEETPPGDDFLAEVCQEWEAAGAPAEEAGVRRVLLRTGIVLSTEGGALPPMVRPFKLFAGGPVGSGRQWMPWIHLDDEVGAIDFLMRHPSASGPFNLTAPNPLTNRELSRAIGRALGRPSLLPAPAFAMRLLFGEMATLLLDGQRAVPRRLEELGYDFRYADADAALADLLG